MRRLLPFLIVLLLIAALFRIDFYFTLLYLLLAIVLLARLWSHNSLHQLRVARHYSNRAFQGETLTVHTTIENKGWLPIPWLEVNEALPVQLRTPPFYHAVISLRPREKRELEYKLECRRRGYFRIGDMQLTSGDLLGVTSTYQRAAPAAPLLIYPKVVPLETLGLPTRAPYPALVATYPLFEDPARVRGVRDYQRGDSPRRIHWRATAHRGNLLVKQLQPAIARDTMICLDLDEESYERGVRFSATELAIVVAASLATHIASVEKLPVGITTRARLPDTPASTITLPPRYEQSHLMALLELLAQVDLVDEGAFVDRLREETATLAWGSTIVIITGRANESLLTVLDGLRRSGYAPTLIVIGAAELPIALRQRTHFMNIPTHRVWEEQDIGEL